MKNTLIINYYWMTYIGGIEKYINDLVKYLILNTDYRIIWFKKKNSIVHESFRQYMLHDKVERYETNFIGIKWYKFNAFNYDSDEKITIVSFSPIDMGRAINFVNSRKINPKNVSLFYIIPNTKGEQYFLEQNFKNKNKYYQRLREIHSLWAKSGCFIGFGSIKQYEALENNYNISIGEKETRHLKEIFELPPVDMDNLIKRSKREQFNIISVGRFDFPHKQYILGLIDKYAVLKEKYKKIHLYIVGHGPMENIVISKINEYSSNITNDIHLLGAVSPAQLPKIFSTMHVNISVAGAVQDGAVSGVISLPARNYCYDGCEVYGYLPESIMKTVSTDKGYDVIPFLEEIINMTDEEFIECSLQSYNAYKNLKVVDPLYIFKLKNYDYNFLNKKDAKFLMQINYKLYIKKILKNNILKR